MPKNRCFNNNGGKTKSVWIIKTTVVKIMSVIESFFDQNKKIGPKRSKNWPKRKNERF